MHKHIASRFVGGSAMGGLLGLLVLVLAVLEQCLNQLKVVLLQEYSE